MPARPLAAACAALALALATAGCDLGGGDDEGGGGDPGARGERRGGDGGGALRVPRGDGHGGRDPVPSDRTVIDRWVRALAAGRYERAADYFAPGAVVEQVRILRLRTHADAVAFNRSLPCRADLTDVRDEGATTLAAFRLRAGPGGPCEGSARVRFTIRGGLIREWRQLPERGPAPGESS